MSREERLKSLERIMAKARYTYQCAYERWVNLKMPEAKKAEEIDDETATA